MVSIRKNRYPGLATAKPGRGSTIFPAFFNTLLIKGKLSERFLYRCAWPCACAGHAANPARRNLHHGLSGHKKNLLIKLCFDILECHSFHRAGSARSAFSSWSTPHSKPSLERR